MPKSSRPRTRRDRLPSSPPGGRAGNATSLITDDGRTRSGPLLMGLLDRGPPTQWTVRRLLAAAVAAGRAGGISGAACSVAHREFSGMSHIGFSMGVSAKVAALHRVERDSLLEPHVGT